MDNSVHTVKYLAVWDMLGLESLFNITELEQEAIMATLREVEFTSSVPLGALILRAQANPQRHYEIYMFESDIEEDALRSMFDEDPQTIVDAIRRCGHQLYSNRAQPEMVRIV